MSKKRKRKSLQYLKVESKDNTMKLREQLKAYVNKTLKAKLQMKNTKIIEHFLHS